MANDIFNTQRAIDLAAAGQHSPVVIFWDTQDPRNIGPAYLYADGSESGSLRFANAVTDGSVTKYAADCEDYFWGDGAYIGADCDGFYPVFIAQ